MLVREDKICVQPLAHGLFVAQCRTLPPEDRGTFSPRFPAPPLDAKMQRFYLLPVPNGTVRFETHASRAVPGHTKPWHGCARDARYSLSGRDYMGPATGFLGIDAGSTTVKVVLMRENGSLCDAHYQCHGNDVQGTLLRMLEGLSRGFPGCCVQAAVTGSVYRPYRSAMP